MNDWKAYAVCTCGWRVEAPFGKKFFVTEAMCPRCGADKDSWKTKTMRWMNLGSFFKPWTWLNGKWETLNERS